jgi:hypothetical protein
MTRKKDRHIFRVGDRVRVRFVLQFIVATIIEDRGFIGAGGRRLWTIKAEFDETNTLVMEVPEEELTAVN